ncbi:MAG: hypothetical protein OXN25_10685 [Candidatus Poribacteria bacterium]|nr:hypothetical protein [Candidatus Poribacteria bacterium]
MKLILISTIAFLIFTAPVFSELTVKDLEKIRSIVKESEDRMKEIIKESEGRVKEHVDLKIKNVTDKVEEMDKRLNLISNFVIALIALIILTVSLPQIIMAWRERGQKAQAEKIEKLEAQIGMIIERINVEEPLRKKESGP